MLNVKNKSFAVTARVEIPDNGADGVVIAQGGAFGGWSMYLVEGRLTFCYNLLGVARIKVQTPDAVPAGVRELRAEFEYDGGGLGREASCACSSKVKSSRRLDSNRRFQ